MTVILTPAECRVLGTLIEKALTVPAQYPLTLNGLANGCSQRSNRDPVVEFDEDAILDALDGLRAKGLAREVSMEGSRVAKYRHVAREGLEVGAAELAVLAELLLRGPQTQGELRGRASRMHPLDSIEVVNAVLESLRNRPAPLIERLAPAPGSRADRYAQLLCPNLHPEPAGGVSHKAPNASASRPAGDGDSRQYTAPAGTNPAGNSSDHSILRERIDALASEVSDLRGRLDRLERDLGAG